LAISRDIVKKHGGELLVESTSGKGTTFTVRLPINPYNGIVQPKES
jgi:signal transduction histidine kinase